MKRSEMLDQVLPDDFDDYETFNEYGQEFRAAPKYIPPQPVRKFTTDEIKLLEAYMRAQGRI